MQIGMIKDRNSMDLTEAEDIKKKWQEYTEEVYKKGLNDPDNHNSVITHLEPDILECDIKWALSTVVLLTHSVLSDALQPRGLQHARLPCPSPSPRVC